mgnify:CR=1 FL=1
MDRGTVETEAAADDARREAKSLRDSEESSKRKLAAEMWAMRVCRWTLMCCSIAPCIR